MKNNKSNRPGNPGAGGPKTSAGKERSKLNALRHGCYSKSLTARSGPLRERATLSRKLYESLEKEFKPEDTAETNCISSMVDALCRKASVLGWEDARIKEEMAKAAAPYKTRERRLSNARSNLLRCEEELTKLEQEKVTGLDWDPVNRDRTQLLAHFIKENKSKIASWTFNKLTTAEERKEYFYRMVQCNEQQLWERASSLMMRVKEHLERSEEELATKTRAIEASGEMDVVMEKSLFLPPAEVEQIMSLVTRCDRQFEKALEFLMKYRAAKVELEARQRASGSQLDEHGAGAQPRDQL